MGRQHDDLASIRWWWRDWRASRARAVMSPLARGIYRELLDAHYGEPDCALPGDDVTLAALASVPLKTWLKVKDEIAPWLPALPNGRLQNSRVKHEWTEAQELRTVRREMAQRGAKARWTRGSSDTGPDADGNAVRNADGMRSASGPESPPNASPSSVVRRPSPYDDNGHGNGQSSSPDSREGGRPTTTPGAPACPGCGRPLYAGNPKRGGPQDHWFCGENRGGCGKRYPLDFQTRKGPPPPL